MRGNSVHKSLNLSSQIWGTLTYASTGSSRLPARTAVDRTMGAKRVASAAGTAALVYAALSGRLSSPSGDAAGAAPRRQWRPGEEDEANKGQERWPERAPATWREAAAVTARTAGFAYAETLGKWPLGDIAFGISHYMRTQVIIELVFARIAGTAY